MQPSSAFYAAHLNGHLVSFEQPKFFVDRVKATGGDSKNIYARCFGETKWEKRHNSWLLFIYLFMKVNKASTIGIESQFSAVLP